MKIDYLKEKKELVLVFLFGLSVFFAVLIMVKITGFFAASARAENILKIAVAQNIADANGTDKYFERYRVLAEALKKNNLFTPPPPRQHPVKEVLGIFGDEVLINGRWYKIGDKVADATITAIEPTKVKIEWEGSEKIFAPISGSASEASGRLSRNTRMGRTTTRSGEAKMVVIGSETRGSGGHSGVLSEKERIKLQRKAEQKLQAEKEKFRKLSKRDAEKIKAQQKKIAAQKKYMAPKKKRNGDSKSKKDVAQRKIKK